MDDSREEVDEENFEIDDELSVEEVDENDINESIVSGEDGFVRSSVLTNSCRNTRNKNVFSGIFLGFYENLISDSESA